MKSAYSVFIALIWSFFLVGCGGGGSISTDPGDGGTPSPVTISIQLSTTNTQISVAENAEITAKVIDSNGAAVSTLVSFTLNNDTYGTFEPGTGEVSTGADGIATIKLNTASIPTGAEVTATISSGEKATINVTMVGDGGETSEGALVVLTLTDTDGNITDTISTTKPGKLVATVTGTVKPVIVTFTAVKGEIPVDAAVTVNGVATVDIFAGSDLGAGKAEASLETGEKGDAIVVVGATNVFMGSGDPFVTGVALISSPQISAGGTATISVKLQDGDNNLFTQPVEVHFTSTCASFSTPQAILSTPVTAVNGEASSTYLAQGCSGDDQINVTANAGGLNLSASTNINILPASYGSIVFESATPTKIGIVGTGLPESSTVVFKVLDTNALPVSNQRVDFAINTDVGGITFDPDFATTNDKGLVQTVVRSGTVATTIRVTGTISGSDPIVASQSNELVVTTGIPDQDSFSLSASTTNPEGWTSEGTIVNITAKLSDAFNNRVPDGTSVTFRTEGGDIVDSCVTNDGGCTVEWQSKDPRPYGKAVQPLAIDGQGRQYWDVRENYYLGQPIGGRATVTAFAIGEESFADTNGNGRFDLTELAAFLGKNTAGEDFDLNEPFEDFNEDGLFNPSEGAAAGGGNLEELIDFDSDGEFDTKDSLYNGFLCAEPTHAGCASFTNQSTSTYIRENLVLVMSGSTAIASQPIVVDSATDTGVHVLDLAPKSVGYVSLCISDMHNQQMPSGSEISSVTSVGSIATTNPIIWPNTNFNGARCETIAVKAPTEPEGGTLTISVTTPSGVISTVAVIDISM
ncbi:hypothetical protein JK628_09025 [Shewanella sp. KX20019]|uniref:hypothetical protein n=1 Tax=Shewanella sp. KX20019 TaxID=2803864 RepID=UPI00192675B6|nr:hypothetical protein [Shewanella sp. KX20019]QQX81931.1 hypothetical protein JK628_09025 [Shewanella sp. KX20019]